MPYKPRFRGTASQPFQSINPENPDDSGLEKPASNDTTIVLAAVIVVVGVIYVFYRRNKEKIVTGPVVTVVPSYEADVSQIQNIIGTVHAITKTNELGAANGT